MSTSLPVVTNDTEPSINFGELIEQIQKGDQRAVETLYTVLKGGIRIVIARQLSSDLVDDTLHDSFVVVISALKAGRVRYPEALRGFVYTIVQRQISARIAALVQERQVSTIDRCLAIRSHEESVDFSIIRKERDVLVKQVLNDLSFKHREVLVRFYLQEQTQEEICTQMNLTGTQFRLTKTRAKSRFAELGNKKLRRDALSMELRRAAA